MNGKEVLRAHDAPTPQGWAEFMKTGWAPSPLDGILFSLRRSFIIKSALQGPKIKKKGRKAGTLSDVIKIAQVDLTKL
jgi:hypothetical protein